jgi:DNA-binding CsgD family transcriptional regulator
LVVVVLVERESQLLVLDRLFQETVAGKGGVSLIRGPVGSGKTELLRTLVERVTMAGGVVLEAVGTDRERDLPFGVLGQLFGGLPASRGQRGARQLLADEAARWSGTAGDVEFLRSQASQELWSVAHRLSEQAPVVIVVDDLQFVDLASLQSLVIFSSRLRSASLMVVATQVDCPLEHVRQGRDVLVTELLRQPRFNLLRTEPLSVDGVGAALAKWINPVIDRPVAQLWHQTTGGNPFLLRALAEDYLVAHSMDGPRPVAEPVVRAEFVRATVACLHRGGQRSLQTARNLAVLAESSSWYLLPSLDDDSPQIADGVIASMNAAGILDGKGFRHRAARTAILAELPDSSRAALHQRVARLLREQGAEPRRIAIHLVAARFVDRAWAFHALVETAQELLRCDDVEFAAKCLHMADVAAMSDEQRMSVSVLRVQVEFRDNPGGVLRRLEALASSIKEGRITVDQMAGLLRPLLWQGHWREAVLILERLAGAFDSLDDRSAAELHVIREWLEVMQPPLLARARGPEVRLPDGVRSIVVEDPLSQASAMLKIVLHHGPDEHTVPTAEWLLGTTELDDSTVCAIRSALLTLVYADRLDLAELWCDAGLREAITRRAPTWQALLTSVRAEIALRRGDMRLARQHARSALGLIPRSAWGVPIGAVVANLMNTATALGRSDTPELRLSPNSDPLFETHSGIQYLYARGRRHLAANRPHAALDDLLTCGQRMRDWRVDLPAFLPWRADAVQALVRLGEFEQARVLAAEQLTRPAVQQPRVRGIVLRTLAATQDDLREREATLLQAVEALENCDDQVQMAYTLADLADARNGLGDFHRARLSARSAIRLAERLQLRPLLNQLSNAAGADAALSAAELRVATLAAVGRANRQIAEELCVTVSTVEQHLTRVYRKLEAKGRADLPARLVSYESEYATGGQ